MTMNYGFDGLMNAHAALHDLIAPLWDTHEDLYWALDDAYRELDSAIGETVNLNRTIRDRLDGVLQTLAPTPPTDPTQADAWRDARRAIQWCADIIVAPRRPPAPADDSEYDDRPF